ncbi:MAG: hypothetical protein AAF657_37590 [Acidobacteriota bacterium]
MHPTRSETLLRRALSANAAFSGLCGILCVVAASSIAQLTGLPKAEVFAFGVNLEVFAALLIFLVTRRDLSRGWARALVMAVIAMDVLWVIGSAAILLTASPLTTAGKWIVFAVAAVVGDLAFFQLRGFRGLRRTTTATQPA